MKKTTWLTYFKEKFSRLCIWWFYCVPWNKTFKCLLLQNVYSTNIPNRYTLDSWHCKFNKLCL